MGSLPVAVRKNVVAIEVAGEVIVQDRDGRELARLDAMTARVWEACDGATPVADIAKALGTGTAQVWTALDTLGDAGLLGERAAPPASTPDVSRRRLLTSLGLGAGIAAAVAAPALGQNRPPKGEQTQKEGRSKSARAEPGELARNPEQAQKETRSKGRRAEPTELARNPEQTQKETRSKGRRAEPTELARNPEQTQKETRSKGRRTEPAELAAETRKKGEQQKKSGRA